MNQTYETLMSFDPGFISISSTVTNSLPQLCDYMSLVKINYKYMSLCEYMSLVNESGIVFVDNVNRELLSDSMDGIIKWKQTSKRAMSNYTSIDRCKSDNKCYLLTSETDFVQITKTINIHSDSNIYNFKDFNLEWSLQTNHLSDGTVLNVEFQCSNNYLH
eukprot:482472_1